MGLSEYKQKRSFKQTPEPAGKKGKARGKLRFVVQKHAASRLHYDFRLELDGVMKSWAVPKGPSLNPADKRMAMMVEDHPIEYNDFEGIIPEGNYGAGTVMIWDEGTYHAYETKDPKESHRILKAGLAKGDFKFTLQGKKLKGNFVLVKTKGWGASKGKDNAWLLIKKADQGASEEDVTAEDRSVRSKRTLEEIAARAAAEGKVYGKAAKPKERAPAKVKVTGSRKGALPRSVKPMLATLVKEPFDRAGWLFEIKWDGYRALSQVSGGKVKLYSRNGQDFTDKYQPLAVELAGLGHDAVLDGEVVVVDANGKSSFQKLQQYHQTGQGDLRYFAFDLIHLDGHDLTKLPLIKRKEILQQLIEGLDIVQYSDHVADKGQQFFEAAVQQELEGIIAKNGDSPYTMARRTPDWLKIKTHRRQEAVIGGFTQPRGSRKQFGALVLGVYEARPPKGRASDGLVYIGHTGTGFGQKLLEDIHAKLKRKVRKTSPFQDEPKTNTPVTWVKPELVCEVEFTEWTADGHLRHPAFVGLREDKPAGEVRREREAATDAVVKEVDSEQLSAPAETEVKIGSARVKLTKQDKVFWPKEGYTKGDVVAYYRGVSELILPYLKGRPQSMNRHPNGIDGQNFYHKDVSSQPPPRYVKTTKIFSEHNDKELEWIVCDNEATLAYLANLGCIELNPWHSRLRKLEKPDYLLIDLDAKTCGFAAVIEVAKAVKKTLDRLGVDSYPKTSGKSGLHICLPLGAKYDYEQSKQFAEILMRFVHRELPELTSVERNPDKRQRQVYLDFLQNRKGQTMAAPYSLRPVPGATVSTPLEWSEVRKGLDPHKFTIKTIAARLAKKGDLWEGVLGKGINLRAALKKLEEQ